MYKVKKMLYLILHKKQFDKNTFFTSYALIRAKNIVLLYISHFTIPLFTKIYYRSYLQQPCNLL